jgi:hypothetical protein
MSMSGSINAEERRLAQQRQQDCLNAAIFAGCKASGTALFVSGGLCAGLVKYSDVSGWLRSAGVRVNVQHALKSLGMQNIKLIRLRPMPQLMHISRRQYCV